MRLAGVRTPSAIISDEAGRLFVCSTILVYALLCTVRTSSHIHNVCSLACFFLLRPSDVAVASAFLIAKMQHRKLAVRKPNESLREADDVRVVKRSRSDCATLPTVLLLLGCCAYCTPDPFFFFFFFFG
jgi:hypothetical protein